MGDVLHQTVITIYNDDILFIIMIIFSLFCGEILLYTKKSKFIKFINIILYFEPHSENDDDMIYDIYRYCVYDRPGHI